MGQDYTQTGEIGDKPIQDFRGDVSLSRVSVLRFVSLWGPVVAFMVALFALSGQSSLPLAERVWDKLVHAGEAQDAGDVGLGVHDADVAVEIAGLVVGGDDRANAYRSEETQVGQVDDQVRGGWLDQ